MAKKCVEARNKRRTNASNHAAPGRAVLRKAVNNPDMGFEEKMAAVVKLNKRARNESKVRVVNRCGCCGRGHGVYRKFGVCRICLRQATMRGLVPGLRKASW